MNNEAFNKRLKKITNRVVLFGAFIILLVGVFLCANYGVFQNDSSISESDYFNQFPISSSIAILDNSPLNREIKYGFELFKNTPKYIGPSNGDSTMVFAGNNLSCNNCHLYAGTKPFSAPMIGVVDRFPQYRGRENKMGTIAERINGCMERSMNGEMMPEESREMQAFIKYLDWLGNFAESKGKFKGQGFTPVIIPERAVNLDQGEQIFNTICAACHGKDGKGQQFKNSLVYQYPPLWGDDSFNNGAGMNRVITAAQFIKSNMPFGATFEAPILTDEEAYDVAGFINQQERPEKANSEKDFPDLQKKPVSTPYPPYLDGYSILQHQLGPFQPIMAYYKLNYGIKKTK
mgnify:CR=1 FL=1